jgi:hypothetical protein
MRLINNFKFYFLLVLIFLNVNACKHHFDMYYNEDKKSWILYHITKIRRTRVWQIIASIARDKLKQKNKKLYFKPANLEIIINPNEEYNGLKYKTDKKLEFLIELEGKEKHIIFVLKKLNDESKVQNPYSFKTNNNAVSSRKPTL